MGQQGKTGLGAPTEAELAVDSVRETVRSPQPHPTRAQCSEGRGQPQRAAVLEGDCGQARPQRSAVLPCSCHLRGTSGGGPALPPWGWRWYFLPLSSTLASTSSSGQLCPSASLSLSLLLPSPSLCLTPDPSSLPIWHPAASPFFLPPPLLFSCSACSFRCPAVWVPVHTCFCLALWVLIFHESFSVCWSLSDRGS